MKVWIWSDVHLEMQKLELPAAAPDGAKIIVCAGDLCQAPDLERIAHAIIDRYDLPMIFVPGNHEYYGEIEANMGRMLSRDRELMQFAQHASRHWKRRLMVLDDASVELDGVRFIGSTLWSDFELGLQSPGELPWRLNSATSMSADFSRIKVGKHDLLSSQQMLNLNRRSRAFLLKELSRPFDGITVVVTHFLPHPDCTPTAYAGSKSNFMFACGERAFGDLLRSEKAPALWVHGHTHHPVDIEIGNIRVICNPIGYLVAPDERKNGFHWNLVVDTETL